MESIRRRFNIMGSGHDNSSALNAQASPVSAPSSRLSISPAALTMGILLFLAFAGLYFRWFHIQGRKSYNQLEDWGHSFVIPAISVYMLWRHRAALAKIAPDVFWPGLAPLMLGIATYFAGIVTIQNHMVQGMAMILTLFGVVLMLFGPRIMHYAFLPIAFLTFAVTISDSIMEKITFQLKLIASEGSWILLSALGPLFNYTIDLSGNVLNIYTSSGEHVPLNVADACSGMRMVIAFYALAGAVALLGTTRWWQRIAIMLVAGPVAIAMNVLRVAVLGLASLIDPDLASGDAHMIIGTILLIPSLLLFMGLVWIFDRLVQDPAEAQS